MEHLVSNPASLISNPALIWLDVDLNRLISPQFAQDKDITAGFQVQTPLQPLEVPRTKCEPTSSSGFSNETFHCFRKIASQLCTKNKAQKSLHIVYMYLLITYNPNNSGL